MCCLLVKFFAITTTNVTHNLFQLWWFITQMALYDYYMRYLVSATLIANCSQKIGNS